MMTFGWRPTESCYAGNSVGSSGTTTAEGVAAGVVGADGGAAVCASTPWWFYVALGLAVVTGAHHRTRRK